MVFGILSDSIMSVSSANPPEFNGFILQGLIRSGMLFELQDWISQGQPLSPCGKRGSAIVEASESGFHSMVRVLLAARDWSLPELVEAAQMAALRGNASIVSLLLELRGVAQELSPGDLSHCIDYDVWRKAIEAGMPLRGQDGFGATFAQVGARPLLRLFKDLCASYPDLELEGRVALAAAVEKGSPRQVALLIWAGVDPLKPSGEALYEEDETSPYHYAPAVVAAISAGRLDLLTLMRLRPDERQWLELVSCGLYHCNVEVLRLLLRINPAARQCIASHPQLHGEFLRQALCRFWHCSIINRWSNRPASGLPVKACVALLMEHGARLSECNPKTLREIRACLYKANENEIVDVIDELAACQDTTHTTGLQALINKPKLRAIVDRLRPGISARLFGSRPDKHSIKQRHRTSRSQCF